MIYISLLCLCLDLSFSFPSLQNLLWQIDVFLWFCLRYLSVKREFFLPAPPLKHSEFGDFKENGTYLTALCLV